MKLFRSMLVAGLVFTVVDATATVAQTRVAPPLQTDIQPFMTVGVGPSFLQSRRFVNGGDHFAAELSLGARKRMSKVFGLVLSANGGSMLQTEIGGADALCRIRQDGKPGCYPVSPVLAWAGASLGAEAYLGRAILGLQFGPTVVRLPKYEAALVSGSSNHAVGLRSQFDANLPIYRQIGLNFAIADHYVPSVVNDRWHVQTFSVGLTLREFHK